jgi:hypothetical protein
MIVPSALNLAYRRINEGAAWVAIFFEEGEAWVYHSAVTSEDVAEDLKYMDHDEHMTYLVEGLLELQGSAEEVD